MAPALAVRTTRAWPVKTTAPAAAAAKALAPEAPWVPGMDFHVDV